MVIGSVVEITTRIFCFLIVGSRIQIVRCFSKSEHVSTTNYTARRAVKRNWSWQPTFLPLRNKRTETVIVLRFPWKRGKKERTAAVCVRYSFFPSHFPVSDRILEQITSWKYESPRSRPNTVVRIRVSLNDFVFIPRHCENIETMVLKCVAWFFFCNSLSPNLDSKKSEK